MTAEKAKITFHGGTGSVTGANFLFEADGKKILVDCGLTQVAKVTDDVNWDPFPYDPKTIDALFISHGHVDHIGRIPKLINDGFKGKIYSTPPTKAIARPMLEDTATILSHNTELGLDKIYNQDNLGKTFSLWYGVPYYEKIKLTENLEASLYNAGHILGSAMIVFTYHGKKFVFTGDLGNDPSPLLPPNDKITDADYLIMESVYGDRNHESRESRRARLQQVIQDNHKRRGTLIIPTFSLERSQELLFELDALHEGGRIPVMPIFFDSPLAIKLTEVFKQYKEYFNEAAQKAMSPGKYLFDFPGLHNTLKTEESKMIAEVPGPKIVIAGSGMSTGGRIIHHEKQYLPDPVNTILLTGYQALGTPGRLIVEGIKKVHLMGEDIPIRAHVETISGYSGHKDSDGLLNFVEATADRLKKVFVVMGEPKSAMFLVQKLRDNLGLEAYAPERGDVVEIDC